MHTRFLNETGVDPDSKSPNISQALGPGSVLDKRFEILELLKNHANGELYRARNLLSSETVCIKVLKREFAENERLQEAFFQEAKLLSKVDHQGLLSIKAFGKSSDGLVYIVQEFFESTSLAELLKVRGALKPHELVPLLIQISQTLAYAHENKLVHGDLSPDKILIANYGLPDLLSKIMDFGLFHLQGQISDPGKTVSLSGKSSGTPAYMSPERCRDQACTPRSDIYSFAAIIFECVYNHPVFSAKTELDLMSKQVKENPVLPGKPVISGRLRKIILRGLEKDPANRFATANELYDELLACQDDIENERSAGFLRGRQTAVFLATFALFLMLAAGLALIPAVQKGADQPVQSKKSKTGQPGSIVHKNIAGLMLRAQKANMESDFETYFETLQEVVDLGKTKLPAQPTCLVGQRKQVVFYMVYALGELARQPGISRAERQGYLNYGMELASDFLSNQGKESGNIYDTAAVFADNPARKKELQEKALECDLEDEKSIRALNFAVQYLKAGDQEACRHFLEQARAFLPAHPRPDETVRILLLETGLARMQNNQEVYKACKTRLLETLEENRNAREIEAIAAFACQDLADAFKNDPRFAYGWNQEGLKWVNAGREKISGWSGVFFKFKLFASDLLFRLNEIDKLHINNLEALKENPPADQKANFLQYEACYQAGKGNNVEALKILAEARNLPYPDPARGLAILHQICELQIASKAFKDAGKTLSDMRDYIKKSGKDWPDYQVYIEATRPRIDAIASQLQ